MAKKIQELILSHVRYVAKDRGSSHLVEESCLLSADVLAVHRHTLPPKGSSPRPPEPVGSRNVMLILFL